MIFLGRYIQTLRAVYEIMFETLSPIPWNADIKWPMNSLYVQLRIAEIDQKKPGSGKPVEEETW